MVKEIDANSRMYVEMNQERCVSVRMCVAEYLSLTTLRGLDDRKKQENTEGVREVKRELVKYTGRITDESK